jgi:hypothetical protein
VSLVLVLGAVVDDFLGIGTLQYNSLGKVAGSG